MTLKKVLFISVWNGGFEVETNAQFNDVTGEVLHIENSNVEVDNDGDELDFLEGQYIELEGERHEVEEKDGLYLVIKQESKGKIYERKI